MNRIEREQKVIGQMVRIYCRHHHCAGPELCADCDMLLRYALSRLKHCRKGNDKSSCRKCVTHCYRPDMREQIRVVMRYVGPRMIFYHPVSAIRHLISEMK